MKNKIKSADRAWNLRVEDIAQLTLHQAAWQSSAVLSRPVHRQVDPEPFCRPRPTYH